jgi:transcriptional regulator with XRE-family HTH domain
VATVLDDDGPTNARLAFGRRLRYWRQLAGLTQRQLAAALRFNHTYVSRLENGVREIPIKVAAHADDLLAAGGELTELALRALGEGDGANPRGVGGAWAVVPLPGASATAASPPELLDWRGWRLPELALECPLHPLEDCTSQIPTEIGLAAESLGRHDGAAAVHLFLGRLAAYTLSCLESTDVGTGADVQSVTWEAFHQAATASNTRPMLHVSASFAMLAAEQRTAAGQFGQAVAWLHRVVEWGTAGGNPSIVCQALTDLSSIARMEGAGASALSYAEASDLRNGAERWMSAHSLFSQARAWALLGDHRRFEERITAARRLIDVFDDKDRYQASWLDGAPGEAFVQSYLAGGWRDLAVHRADPALAVRAARCAEQGLAAAPNGMERSRLLLGIRLADSCARARQLDAAEAVAESVWREAVSADNSLIRHELRYLRASLSGRVPTGKS